LTVTRDASFHLRPGRGDKSIIIKLTDTGGRCQTMAQVPARRWLAGMKQAKRADVGPAADDALVAQRLRRS
jgi:hypothetical protein